MGAERRELPRNGRHEVGWRQGGVQVEQMLLRSSMRQDRVERLPKSGNGSRMRILDERTADGASALVERFLGRAKVDDEDGLADSGLENV